MRFRLIRREGDFPPGGFLFQDPRTGMAFKDGDFNSIVSQIQRHRMANSSIYPKDDGIWLDSNAIADELDFYTCQRIGNQARYCREYDGKTTPPVVTTKVVLMPTPCLACGELNGQEKYCQTCGGKKVNGWICVRCGFVKSK